MAKPNPRQSQNQQVHYIRYRVQFGDANVATGEYIGTLPAGAIIIGSDFSVPTAFNAATTNSLTVGGNSPTYNDVATAAGTLVGATGLKQNVVPTGSSLNSISADLDIYAVYQQTGTAASAGVCDVMVKYIPNNDK